MIKRDRDIPMEMQDRTGRRIAKVLTLMAQGMDKTNRATIESLTQTVLANGCRERHGHAQRGAGERRGLPRSQSVLHQRGRPGVSLDLSALEVV